MLAVLALAIVGLSSCGGSDSGSTPTQTSGNAESQLGGQGGSGNGKEPGGQSEPKEDKSEGKPSGSAPVAPLRVSGGGSDQFRVKEGDNSIQDFGAEESESELEEAATALHDFYVARTREEWRRACANLSKTVSAQLEQLAARGKQGGQTGCPAALAAITPGLPPKVARETTIVNAGSLRVEGDRGFLIYRSGEGTVYAINMTNEGDWKVGALAGVPIS